MLRIYSKLFRRVSQTLLHDTLLQILCQVAANLLTSILGSNLGHIALYHDLHQFLERGGVRIPVELCLCLCWVTPEVNHVGRTVEVWRYLNECLADEFLRTLNSDTLLVLFLAFPLQFDAYIVESQLGELTN